MPDRGTVLFVGTFPPPVHGMAVATDSLAATLEEMGVPIERVDLVRGSSGTCLAKVRKSFRALRAAIVVGAKPPGALLIGADAGLGLLLQLPLVWAAILRGVPTFLLHHSTVVPDGSTRVARLVVRLCGARVTHVLLCEVLEARMSRAYPEAHLNLLVVGNGHVFRDRLTSPRSKTAAGETCDLDVTAPLRVGHLSNLDTAKGFALVGDAVAELRRSGHVVEYHLGGRPVDDSAALELARIRRDLGADLVEYGFVGEAGKTMFFSSIDVFAFPSTYVNECSPLVVWEALHAGVPVISSSVGCLDDQRLGQAVLPVPQPCAATVAAALSSLRSMPDRSSEVAEAARNDVVSSLEQVRALVGIIGFQSDPMD